MRCNAARGIAASSWFDRAEDLMAGMGNDSREWCVDVRGRHTEPPKYYPLPENENSADAAVRAGPLRPQRGRTIALCRAYRKQCVRYVRWRTVTRINAAENRCI